MSQPEVVDDETVEREELEIELAVLREQNDRLRDEYQRRLQAGYRRSALGFAGLAVLAGAVAIVVPALRDVLTVIAAIAAFAALLTYYLTPERFVAATVGESVYAAVARTGDDLVSDLGLQDTTIYLPANAGERVFIPQHRDYAIPDEDALETVLVVPEDDRARGVAVSPTGRDLVDEFEATTSNTSTTDTVAEALAEALVEQFELVDSAVVDSREPGRVTFAITGSAYRGVDRFDHPVPSFLATGLARTLDTPVELETVSDDGTSLVTCRWTADDAVAGEQSGPRSRE